MQKPDKQELDLMLKSFSKGIICICPFCLKVDINPNDHFATCDPGAEERKRFNDEFYD